MTHSQGCDLVRCIQLFADKLARRHERTTAARTLPAWVPIASQHAPIISARLTYAMKTVAAVIATALSTTLASAGLAYSLFESEATTGNAAGSAWLGPQSPPQLPIYAWNDTRAPWAPVQSLLRDGYCELAHVALTLSLPGNVSDAHLKAVQQASDLLDAGVRAGATVDAAMPAFSELQAEIGSSSMTPIQLPGGLRLPTPYRASIDALLQRGLGHEAAELVERAMQAGRPALIEFPATGELHEQATTHMAVALHDIYARLGDDQGMAWPVRVHAELEPDMPESGPAPRALRTAIAQLQAPVPLPKPEKQEERLGAAYFSAGPASWARLDAVLLTDLERLHQPPTSTQPDVAMLHTLSAKDVQRGLVTDVIELQAWITDRMAARARAHSQSQADPVAAAPHTAETAALHEFFHDEFIAGLVRDAHVPDVMLSSIVSDMYQACRAVAARYQLPVNESAACSWLLRHPALADRLEAANTVGWARDHAWDDSARHACGVLDTLLASGGRVGGADARSYVQVGPGARWRGADNTTRVWELGQVQTGVVGSAAEALVLQAGTQELLPVIVRAVSDAGMAGLLRALGAGAAHVPVHGPKAGLPSLLDFALRSTQADEYMALQQLRAVLAAVAHPDRAPQLLRGDGTGVRLSKAEAAQAVRHIATQLASTQETGQVLEPASAVLGARASGLAQSMHGSEPLPGSGGGAPLPHAVLSASVMEVQAISGMPPRREGMGLAVSADAPVDDAGSPLENLRWGTSRLHDRGGQLAAGVELDPALRARLLSALQQHAAAAAIGSTPEHTHPLQGVRIGAASHSVSVQLWDCSSDAAAKFAMAANLDEPGVDAEYLLWQAASALRQDEVQAGTVVTVLVDGVPIPVPGCGGAWVCPWSSMAQWLQRAVDAERCAGAV